MASIDQSLLNELESALLQSPHVRRDRVHLETHAGHVVVRGQVGSYYQKLMAQEALMRVDGVEQLENQLEVLWA